MKVLQTNFYGDHNIGLFGRGSDSFCVVGSLMSEKNVDKIKKLLKVKIVKLTIARTDLTGIFCCINSNGIVLPKIITEKEFKMFHALEKKIGINVGMLDSKFTAIGNLILANDNGAIISKLFTKSDKKIIEDCLDVKTAYSNIVGMNIVGSCGVATNKGCLLHRDANKSEVKVIEDILGVPADIGTANFGSPFVGSCMIANSNGVIIGESTTGPEINRLMEALQFI